MDWKEIEKMSTEEAMTGATLGIVWIELEKMGEATGLTPGTVWPESKKMSIVGGTTETRPRLG